MERSNQPVYMIGVAAELCGVHPQTLRQYERLGLVQPARAGSKNRLFSDFDIERVRQIQRLTQEMGVNLAGVEIVLRLLDELADLHREAEERMSEYRRDLEEQLIAMLANSTAPIRRDASLLPVPRPLRPGTRRF
ncbi:MAG: helix-turn-helix transcriptional regulator [Fimbriimonadaceae bacterium]